jgi:hypothetical protein
MNMQNKKKHECTLDDKLDYLKKNLKGKNKKYDNKKNLNLKKIKKEIAEDYEFVLSHIKFLNLE